MGGKTSTESKTKYNAKSYDEIKVRVRKGDKEQLKAFAAARGLILNEFITRAVAKAMHDGALKTECHVPFLICRNMW